MFPIRDHNPSSRTPWVTYALVAANVVVFLFQWRFADNGPALSDFYDRWALIPAAVTYDGAYQQLFTSMFLHAGFMHIGGNMLFLWIFGDNLEDQMGHAPYLIFYFACGLAAGLTQVLTDPASTTPTVGASGAIAGVMGGYLLLFPRARVDILVIFIIFFRVFSIPAFLLLGLWFGLQVLGEFDSRGATGGIAYLAHIGGFLAGLLLTMPLWLWRGGPGFWQTNGGQPPHPAAIYSASTIPIVRRRK